MDIRKCSRSKKVASLNCHGRTLTVQRPVYRKVLYEQAIELGVTVRLGCHIEEIDESFPSLRLVGGEEFRADLIIGADGEFKLWFAFADLTLL
jgi:2-polyprenyl-6-methoxyphenol hydroxylase-like FAD-dependent oxidoreductase